MLHTLGNLPLALSERKVRATLRQIIFKKGRICCTKCGYFRIISLKKEDRYFCKRCRKKFSLLSHTWLKNLKIPLALFILLLWFWLSDYQVGQVNQLTGLSIPTIRKYFRLFRLHIVKTVEFKAENHVQVDEAYFGTFRKQANYFHGQKTYKVMNKVCVAGISCPQTGQLTTMVVPDTNKGQTIRNFIYQKVPTNIRVHSDGSHIYTNLRADYFHISRTHDLGFHYAYYIESCWSWMKRKLFKQYHHFTRKYAKEYVSELTFKFNTRKSDKNPFEYLSKSF
jgi:transposase-like protein